MLVWDARYRVGMPELDSQHMIIFSILAQIDAAAAAGTAATVGRDILRGLRDFATFHLRYEEVLMERIGYPALEQHTLAHEILMERIERLLEATCDDDDALHQAKDLVVGWFIDHIFGEDVLIADFALGTDARLDRPDPAEVLRVWREAAA